MLTHTSLHNAHPAFQNQTRLEGDVAHECDWCGRSVRPHTAFRRILRGDDGNQVLILCADCERGTD